MSVSDLVGNAFFTQPGQIWLRDRPLDTAFILHSVSTGEQSLNECTAARLTESLQAASEQYKGEFDLALDKVIAMMSSSERQAERNREIRLQSIALKMKREEIAAMHVGRQHATTTAEGIDPYSVSRIIKATHPHTRRMLEQLAYEIGVRLVLANDDGSGQSYVDKLELQEYQRDRLFNTVAGYPEGHRKGRVKRIDDEVKAERLQLAVKWRDEQRSLTAPFFSIVGKRVKASGSVLWFDPIKGIGVIVSPDNAESDGPSNCTYVHCSCLQGGVLSECDRVEFEAIESDGEWLAVSVTKI